MRWEIDLIRCIIKTSMESSKTHEFNSDTVVHPYDIRDKTKSSTSTEAYNGNDAIKDDEGEYNTGRWTHEEHEKFLHALKMYGKEWKKVQEFVGTRSSTQARSHAQKFFSKMGKGSCSNSPHKKDLSYKTKKSKKIIEGQEKAEVFKVSENTPDTYTSKVTLNISEIDYLNTHPYRRLTFNEDELDSHFYSSLAEEAHMSFDNYSDFKYNEEPMFTDCFESILK